MAQHTQSRPIDSAVELLKTNGFSGWAEAVTILLNSAMVGERSEHLGTAPYERSVQCAANRLRQRLQGQGAEDAAGFAGFEGAADP